MLTRSYFPPSLFTFASLSLAAAALLVALTAPPARADSQLLHGPFPFLKDNEVSAHYLLAAGVGDSWSGDKVGLSYDYRLGGPIWLDLELNLQTGHCRFAGSCANTGDVYETMVGGKWMFRTALPLVPYAKAAAGLLYLFPDEATSAVGLAVRGGGGVNYFFFDWLGFGVEANVSLGGGFFDATYTASHGYYIFDFGGGVAAQF
jgi:hypothetical protein